MKNEKDLTRTFCGCAHSAMVSQLSAEPYAKIDAWPLGIEPKCCAHLQMGVLTDIVAIDADLDPALQGAIPRILKKTQLHVVTD